MGLLRVRSGIGSRTAPTGLRACGCSAFLVTHAHWDHYTQAVKWQRQYGATTLADDLERLELEPYERDMPVGDLHMWLRGGEKIDCGNVTIVAHATPSHTRGDMVFEDRADDLLFTRATMRYPPSRRQSASKRAPDQLPLQSYLDEIRDLVTSGAETAHDVARLMRLDTAREDARRAYAVPPHWLRYWRSLPTWNCLSRRIFSSRMSLTTLAAIESAEMR